MWTHRRGGEGACFYGGAYMRLSAVSLAAAARHVVEVYGMNTKVWTRRRRVSDSDADAQKLVFRVRDSRGQSLASRLRYALRTCKGYKVGEVDYRRSRNNDTAIDVHFLATSTPPCVHPDERGSTVGDTNDLRLFRSISYSTLELVNVRQG